MKILFISFAEISLRGGSVRTVAMLYALADAGHRVDLLAPCHDLPDHSNIRLLLDRGKKSAGQLRLRIEAMRAMRRGEYDAVHAAGSAGIFAAQHCRWKKTKLIYDACRCCRGASAAGSSGAGAWFPKHVSRLEARLLERAAGVFYPWAALGADLRNVVQDARLVHLADIPAQSLYTARHPVKTARIPASPAHSDYAVVCSALPGHSVDSRTLFIAVRKMIESLPNTTFFIRGISQQQARRVIASLDIEERCVFLPEDQPAACLSILDRADAALLLPAGDTRYIDAEVYTLLNSGAPIVVVHDTAYDAVLTEKTSVRVLPNADAIAEGLLRTIREPLLSLALAMEGQQLIAARHSYSSFKHKIRMTYHELNPGHPV